MPIDYTIVNMPLLDATTGSYKYVRNLSNEMYKNTLINLKLRKELNIDTIISGIGNITDNFGKKLEYMPDIGEDKSVRLGDFKWNNEIWELKEIKENAKSKKRAVDNAIMCAKEQANNIILDISDARLSRELLIEQTEKIFASYNRRWVNKIIIFDKGTLLKVYVRK